MASVLPHLSTYGWQGLHRADIAVGPQTLEDSSRHPSVSRQQKKPDRRQSGGIPKGQPARLQEAYNAHLATDGRLRFLECIPSARRDLYTDRPLALRVLRTAGTGQARRTLCRLFRIISKEPLGPVQ